MWSALQKRNNGFRNFLRILDVKDIPAQWANIRQGLDIFRISSKCVCLSNGEVYENLTVPFSRN